MKRIDYVIKNTSPVNFSEQSVDSIYYETKRFIPGSALRGALANLYIAEKHLLEAHTDSTFRKLFLDGEVKYLPAYPIGNLYDFDTCPDSKIAKDEIAEIEPFVLPLSLMKNKAGATIKDLATGEDPGAGFKKVTGFAVRVKKAIYRVEPKVQITFHMSRNEDKERFVGSSREGHIYNYEYLEPMQLFKGSIYISDEVDNETVTKLENMLHGDIRLGRAKNAQYGVCKIRATEIFDLPEGDIADTAQLSYLYALTPFVPYGEWQNAEEAFREAISEINKKINKDAITIKCTDNTENKTIFAAKDFLNGYVGVWHAKRAMVPVIAEGTLFAIECNVEKNEIAKVLNEVESVLHGGLGQRTQEGFGQLRLWKPYDEIAFSDMPESDIQVETLPVEVVERAKLIIHTRLLQEISRKAKEHSQKLNTVALTQGKHIFKRIENLMESELKQKEIQDYIKTKFKEAARKNLDNIKVSIKMGSKIPSVSLLKVITGEFKANDQVLMPYSGIIWEDELGITEGKIKKLKQQLCCEANDLFGISADELYKHYWLWFMRHAVKKKKEEPVVFNKQISSQLNAAKGGRA